MKTTAHGVLIRDGSVEPGGCYDYATHMVYALIRPALFRLDPERAHGLAIRALKVLPSGRPAKPGGPLAVTVAGIDFPNPLGMAAGFDKDAEVADALLGLGFGFAEVGSITPFPQAGNPKPRLFRLEEDLAVINRMGFNNGGAQAALVRLQARRRSQGIVGVNIGANKESPDRIKDYAQGARIMAPHAAYLVVNVSSPNTPGLRALQDDAALAGTAGRGSRSGRRGLSTGLPQGRPRSRARRYRRDQPKSPSTNNSER